MTPTCVINPSDHNVWEWWGVVKGLHCTGRGLEAPLNVNASLQEHPVPPRIEVITPADTVPGGGVQRDLDTYTLEGSLGSMNAEDSKEHMLGSEDGFVGTVL